MKPAAAALLSLFVILPAHAACSFNLRFENGALRWDPIPSATRYRVMETIGRTRTHNYVTEKPVLAPGHRASLPASVHYVVTADLADGVRSAATDSTDSCSASLDATIPIDPAFRKLTRKAILPIVGSTAGANGARFSTDLTLRGNALQRGRLVFHPAGKVASDDDPSIPYDFIAGPTRVFDDVVAEIGQSGIGSLDIIPDEDSMGRVPAIEAYIFNETPEGTFGTFAAPAFPFDYLHVSSHVLTIPDSRFRVNVGFRTLTDTTIRFAVFGPDQRLLDFYEVSFPAGWMQMTSAASLARRTLEPGESLALFYLKGSTIGFHTITENATNDSTLILGESRGRSLDVDGYVD